MAIQIVMDQTGDTRHWFNPDDTEALLKAEKRFKSLITVGYTAAVRDAAGKATVTRSFDPTAEETIFFPLLAARRRRHVDAVVEDRNALFYGAR